ncbi:hypothetical protein DSM112329_03490 [Paraconexibacter sp. AEG42_29]|uniref:Roadblock/LAMTOR2 domain-containing protein n=1 Tax=Paraconexibacter sp. AEG42_29 TaxID=2997339 RepID=A0AAU7AYQ5_9ACTN
MTDAVPARIALAYLATLSADLRSAVIVAADGEVVAGDAGLEPAATRLLDGAGPAEARKAAHSDGTLFAARSDGHLLALAVGPHALEAVVVHDLLATLDDLRDW